ncbi:uncharacterized protein LOC116608628 isoform X2 [Nematostella vectensis]|uniref:uncharacterized protein LOC116608628 isoform X2 n=1 Tax=Nematostella vectensis TaxID=45351 RepID=UPI0020776448|nr:uncharacterized protein LOC116608628 isoform X2 [Nematostella vectensis]
MQKRFSLGKYMREAKLKRQKVIDASRELQNLEDEFSSLQQSIVEKKLELKAKREKLRRLSRKVDSDSRMEGNSQEGGSQKGFLNEKAVYMRRKNPTCFTEGGVMQPGERTIRSRRAETYRASQEIHGGSAEVGLVDAALVKCSEKVISQGIERNKRIRNKIIPKFYNNNVKVFEKSNDNMLRSVGLYYAGGIMGKGKYRSVYRHSSYRTLPTKSKSLRMKVGKSNIPRLVPYNKLMPFINSIDIGLLRSVRDDFCADLPEVEKVDGMYRPIQDMLLKLAHHYLTQEQYPLKWFNGETDTFYVSIGGDGAPFGKDDTATAFLVSFLNIGRGVLSSNENFLLFGANCAENCTPVARFVKDLTKAIKTIESSTFSVICNGNPVEVKFRISELPNDMKMLCFLGGELSNSAQYFSSFADVRLDNCADLSATFGVSAECKWQPWQYADRLKVVKSVEKLKKDLSQKKLASSTKRAKVTSHIANLGSRQEFVPLVEDLIDRAHVDPLHLKNNAVALAHRYLLGEVIAQSGLKSSNTILFSQIPSTNPFAIYIKCMREQCSLPRLAKKVVRWFNETQATILHLHQVE